LQRRATTGRQVFDRPAVQRFRAVLEDPATRDMTRQKWGRIALEAFSAIMARDLTGTGVTVNVLVPGGVTNTGMVPLEAR
jgi:20S proteasome alpha/beta subunit